MGDDGGDGKSVSRQHREGGNVLIGLAVFCLAVVVVAVLLVAR
jgi:hypothetical protein